VQLNKNVNKMELKSWSEYAANLLTYIQEYDNL